MIPKASTDLHGYHAWRRGLVPLEIGTVVKWLKPYVGLTLSDNIKPGQLYKITEVRKPMMSQVRCDADLVYDMILVSAAGKEFKRRTAFSVEGIAKYIHENDVTLV